MAEVSVYIGIQRDFSRRLLPLTVAIGLFIGLGVPVTFWVVEHHNLQDMTTTYAKELAGKFTTISLDSPALWKYQTYNFIAISEGFHPNLDMLDFCILDEKGQPVTAYESGKGWESHGGKLSFAEKLKTTRGVAPIVFNNRQVGSVIVLASDARLLRATFILLGLSALFGPLLALIAYRYLVKIVTGLEKAQEELADIIQQSERKYRSLVNNIPDVIWTSDRAGETVFISPNLEKVYGFTPAEVCSAGDALFFGRIHPDDLERVRASYEVFFDQGGIFDVEYRAQRKDGEWIWLHDRAVEIYEIAGVTYADGLFTDITDRKHAEETLTEQARELTRSNAELEQFAYVASHDLQEPLRMVVSYMQLLSRRYRGKLDADADEFIAFAVDGANRMQKLINDLLLYSRVGTKGKEPQPTDCNPVLRYALNNLQEAIGESGAEVLFAPLPIVMGDEVQLIQLFQNLIGNAVKFRGEEPPRVEVRAEQQGKEWLFSVGDNGIGIEEKDFERIFQIFQRLHDRASYPGTGIGLAVCKKIVERHGGRLWLESTPGQGTTFYFTIPTEKGGTS